MFTTGGGYWLKERRKTLLAEARNLRRRGVLGLRVGGVYRSADGKKHGPIRIHERTQDRFTDQFGNWYGADGHYWQQPSDCPFRLVSEIK